MNNMKTYRTLILFFVTMFVCFSSVHAQQPAVRGTLGYRHSNPVVQKNDIQNNRPADGPLYARVSSRTFDPGTLTWHVTVFDTVCDKYENSDYFGYVSYTSSGTYSMHFVTDEDYDSLVTLHLIVRNSTSNLLSPVSACDSYTWPVNGLTYTTSENINYTLPSPKNSQGCDSILILRLTINHSSSSSSSVTACDKYRWPANRVWYYTSGTYNFTRSNSTGCDSNMTLNLTIHHGDTLDDTKNVCDSYTWEGDTYTSTTTQTKHLQNRYTCDSMVTLHLTVRHSTSSTTVQNVCDSYTWNVASYGGASHTVGTYTTSGTRMETVTNKAGCDSNMTLNLTVRKSSAYVANQTACDSYTWQVANFNGTGSHTVGTYTSSTSSPTATVVNKAGCDSNISLHLTVYHKNLTGTASANVCDSYTWNGSTYTVSGSYPYATQTTHGCDSLATLSLVVRYSNSGTQTANVCDSYTWNVANYGGGGSHAVGTYTSSTSSPTAVVVNKAGCDSTVHLNLVVRRSSSYNDVHDVCDSYTWVNGATYTLSTNTPTHVITNAAGCDSTMRLKLTVRHSSTYTDVHTACDNFVWHGNTYTTDNSTATYTTTNAVGCDSTVTLNLTMNGSTFATDPHTVCDSYTWHGVTYTSSNNTAQYHTTNAKGCDSTVTLNLTVNYTSHVIDEQTACYSYDWHGGHYTASTSSPIWTGTNASGCDSVVNLNLTIINNNTYTTNATACDSYTWNGTTFTSSVINETRTLTNHWGCDSIDVLNLTINHSTSSTDVKNRCDSYTWLDGNTYTVNNNTATYHTTNTQGCDSLITLNLTIRKSTIRNDVHDVCDRYTWVDGNTYTNTTTATYVVPAGNAAGCDSTVYLNLTVRKSTPVTLPAVTRCDSYEWNTSDPHGHSHVHTYTVSGTYRDTLVNMVNCDSINTLPLTINYSFHNNDNQTVCDTYTWHTSDANGSDAHTFGPFTSNAVQVANQHTIKGCDSVVTLHLTVYHKDLSGTASANECDSYTWNGSTYTASGSYQYNTTTSHGCDSMATLTLVIRHSTSSTTNQDVCDSYIWHGNAYTSSTTSPTHVSTNSQGCDSTEHLHLIVRHSTSSTNNQNVCDTYHWDATNMDYTASGTYNKTLVNSQSCDSNLTLNLTVRHATSSTFDHHACNSYTWHGNTYTSSNNTATFTTLNAAGCDSVVHLNLVLDATINVIDYVDSCQRCTWHGAVYYTNNNTASVTDVSAAGCDSITTLHLTIHHPAVYSASASACDSYVWDGDTYTLSCFPQKTFTDQWGCDSVVNLALTIYHTDEHTVLAQSACDSYTWNTSDSHGNHHTYSYTASAMGQKDTLVSVDGCDSILTLNLTIRYQNASTDVHNVCDSYIWHGNTYTNSNNTATWTGTNADGCDSVVTLNLTVRHSTASTNTQNVCESYLWDATGSSYTTTGIYNATLTNAAGCDSNLALNLTVRYNTSSIVTESKCDSYTWHGNTYTYSTTTPTYTTTNAAGCDSTATLHLTIRNSTTGIDTQNECDSYTWHGTTYVASTTTPTFHTLNAVGCDSTATLHLTIRYSSDTVHSHNVCDQFTWVDGNTYTVTNNTARYNVPGGNAVACDSVAKLNLIVRHRSTLDIYDTACNTFAWHGNTYTATTVDTWSTTNFDGCDSLETLYLTVDYTKSFVDNHDTCDTYTWTNGVTYTSTTSSPVQHLYTALGHCDSTATLHLIIRNSSSSLDVQTACDTYTWPKNGTTYTVSNFVDTVHLLNTVSCDSLITLNLTVNYSNSYTDVHNVCDSIEWHGNKYYTNNNTATFNTLNAANCDSLVTLDLTVRYSTTGVDTKDICDSITWLDGNLYTANNSTAQAHILNTVGCDSLVTLNLNVRYNSSTPYSVTSCDTYTWPRNSSTYNNSNTYYYNYTSASNCPSVDTLYLTINPSSHLASTVTACESYQWDCHDHHQTYTSTGNYTHDYTNTFGCASTDTLHLTVNFPTSTSYTADVCDTYTWNDRGWDTVITASGTYLHDYTVLNCPSTDTLYLTVRYNSNEGTDTTVCDTFDWVLYDTTFTYTVSGYHLYNYTNAVNCPSTDTLNLVVNYNSNHIDTVTACETYQWARDGITYTFDGHFGYNYLTAENCPSIDSLYLTINHRTDTTWIDTACDYYVWQRNNTAYNHDGVYTYGPYMVSGNVCQNYDTLYVKVWHKDLTGQVYDTACDSYTWHGRTCMTDGDYNFDTLTVHGCDSLVILHLCIKHNEDTTYIVPNACDYYVWNCDTINYYYDSTGIYYHHYTTQWGCASVNTLMLTVNYKSDTVYIDTACDQYTWTPVHVTDGWSRAYTSSVADTHAYLNQWSCPSLDSIYLTVYPSPRGVDTLVACDSLVWRDSVAYHMTTTFPEFTTDSPVWCDSIIGLNLTVNYSYHVDSVDYFCSGSSYLFHDSVIVDSGTYYYHGYTVHTCDSTITLDLYKLERPELKIEETHSCSLYEYDLSVDIKRHPSLNLDYTYYWYTDPEDLTLRGQEYDSVVSVHPVRDTRYYVKVDYDVLPLCDNTADTALVPIVQPHAIIKTTPPYVEAGGINFTAEDKSYDYTDRAWYLNGDYWGDERTFSYSAPTTGADSVALTLISSTVTCADTADLLVPIYNFNLYIPNVFTPTEPTNKVFKVVGHSVKQFEMWIYTRQGLLVYHSTDINEGWDGRYKNELCPQAAYVYQIHYNTVVSDDAWHNATGTVMLVR